MTKERTRRLLQGIAAKIRRWHNPVLNRTLDELSDDEIDDALARARLTRTDLFAPNDAIAQHRVRMAFMLASLGINVGQAVREHWASLKRADHNCSRCTQTGRCHRWLEWGRPNTGPQVFCHNATFFMSIDANFMSIDADQSKHCLGSYLTQPCADALRSEPYERSRMQCRIMAKSGSFITLPSMSAFGDKADIKHAGSNVRS